MSILQCHACGWSQEPFWSEDGHPFKDKEWLDHLQEALFKDQVIMDLESFADLGVKLEDLHSDTGEVPTEDCDCEPTTETITYYYITGQEYVALILEQKADRIRNMLVKTYEEWKQIKDTLKCPVCGQQDWEIC